MSSNNVIKQKISIGKIPFPPTIKSVAWGFILAMALLVFNATGQTRYRAIVAYTPAVRAAHADMRAFINLMITETNQSYTNSGINAQVVLARTVELNYTETGNWATDVGRFWNRDDAFMEGIFGLRDQYSADVCVLLLNNPASCGQAQNINVGEGAAFVCVNHTCATGNYSFGHEIGHLFGCRHDRLRDNTATPWAWQHGYRAPGENWRTIMAYDCVNADGTAHPCPRLQYWSNPGVLHPTTREAMGTTALEDDHRVMNDRIAAVSAFRTTAATQTYTDVIGQRDFADGGGTQTVNLGSGFRVDGGGVATFTCGQNALAKKGAPAAGGYQSGIMPAINGTFNATCFMVGKILESEFRLDADANFVSVTLFQFNGKKLYEKVLGARKAGIQKVSLSVPRILSTVPAIVRIESDGKIVLTQMIIQK